MHPGTISHQFFLRSATGPQRRTECPQHHHLLCPPGTAERLSLRHALANGGQLRICLRRIHPCDPVKRALHGPRAQRDHARASAPLPCTPPSPALSSLDQSCTKRIALHIPTDREEVFALFHDIRLEPSLVEMTVTHRMMMGMPALRMHERQPAHEAREIAVLVRPEHQMPMIGHQAIGKYPFARFSTWYTKLPGAARSGRPISRGLSDSS